MYLTQTRHNAHSSSQVDILPPLRAPSLADEVHHRVANSLQLLVASLSLEARGIADGPGRCALERMQVRIAAIAGVHRQLYRRSEEGDVDLGGYLAELGASLDLGCPPGRRVLVRAAAFAVPCEEAAAIGMIVSELVTNACKHAYPVGAPGDVAVRLHQASGGYRLTVEDRGRGWQEAGSGESLGHRLITSLARQLDASIAWLAAAPGTRFEMVRPAR